MFISWYCKFICGNVIVIVFDWVCGLFEIFGVEWVFRVLNLVGRVVLISVFIGLLIGLGMKFCCR